MKTALAWAAVCIAVGAIAQERTAELTLPYGPTPRLASPDGSRVLYGIPYRIGVNDGTQLWIEDTRTRQRRMLIQIEDTLSAAWSPDGKAFSVNDHTASDTTRAYIYDADTLGRLNVADSILKADRDAEPYAQGHAYFDIERWDGPQWVLVHFHGHTDQPPVVCFDFRYRVSRTGTVEKLSQRVVPISRESLCRE